MQAYERLEVEWGKAIEKQHVVACASGSAALHLALLGLDLPPGSEVLVPEFTMVACARAVTLAGLRPSFVDCGDDLLMDPRLARQKITSQTKAIMTVHIYGRQCDMAAFGDLAKEYSLYLVEDCAEYHGGPLYSDSHAYCWSFYSNKIVAGEEGGAVAFKNPIAARVARHLRCHGFTPKHNFFHLPGGWNHRLSNANASLILQNLEEGIEPKLDRRRRVEAAYDAALPPAYRMPSRRVPWVYDVRIRGCAEGQIENIVDKMRQAGIEARCGFKAMSRQPEYLKSNFQKTNAHLLSREVLYLPITDRMTEEDARKNVEFLMDLLKARL